MPDEPSTEETASDEPTAVEDDDDVEGHVFVSRTRPHEQGGTGPGISGAINPDGEPLS